MVVRLFFSGRRGMSNAECKEFGGRERERERDKDLGARAELSGVVAPGLFI